MNDKLMLSPDITANDSKALKSRLQLINQIGYGRVTGNQIQTDRLIFDSFTARSVGKENVSESIMNTNFNSVIDSKIMNPSALGRGGIKHAIDHSIISAQIATE